MKKRLPFLFGLVLGPFGVLVSWLVFGRETFLQSIKGVGAWCCILCLWTLGKSNETEDEDDGKPPQRIVASEKTMGEERLESVKMTDAVVTVRDDAVEEPGQTNEDGQHLEIAANPSEQETQEKMNRIQEAIFKYKDRHGKLPTSLADVSRDSSGAKKMPLRDAWGKRFVYEVDDDDFAVGSAGVDTLFDTDDDLFIIWRSTESTQEERK